MMNNAGDQEEGIHWRKHMFSQFIRLANGFLDE